MEDNPMYQDNSVVVGRARRGTSVLVEEDVSLVVDGGLRHGYARANGGVPLTQFLFVCQCSGALRARLSR